MLSGDPTMTWTWSKGLGFADADAICKSVSPTPTVWKVSGWRVVKMYPGSLIVEGETVTADGFELVIWAEIPSAPGRV